MNVFKKYLAYLKDNPEGYWFKRKLYGWGWVPVTLQGWMVVGLYIILVILSVLTLNEDSALPEVAFTFLLPLALLTFALIRICYKKGEPPRWQWGIPPEEEHAFMAPMDAEVVSNERNAHTLGSGASFAIGIALGVLFWSAGMVDSIAVGVAFGIALGIAISLIKF